MVDYTLMLIIGPKNGEDMKQKLKKTYKDFITHFGYAPNFPNNMDFNQDEYAGYLRKYIEDNFDYTIEKYGTKPPKYFGRANILID